MKLNRFAWYAWGVLGYNLLVILWGAFVRASGSGAGCGAHWPLCDGQVIPRAPEVATLIELTHRATSGIALVLVVALLVWAFRAYPKGHTVRLGALLSFALIISEALVGAGLVLFGLTAENDSVARAVVIAIHLVNTFLLLAALTLTAWWASGGARLRLRRRPIVWALAVALLGTLLLGMTGAITALGDTLFPAGSLAEGVGQDFADTAHFLVRLRVIHPLIAVALSIYITGLAWYISRREPGSRTERIAWILTGLFLTQLLIGALNIGLLAPIWLQLIHLLMADIVWITLVVLAATVLADPQAETAPATARSVVQPV